MPPLPRRLLLALLILSNCISLCEASDRMDGRYSFSLTTFDPTGKLGQVERATAAAALGAPIVAVALSDSIVMACPQVLQSPLIVDDGTSRFTKITKEIVVAHTGLSADGRVLVAAAQRMAVEHEYTFDETIPIELFLEGLSLLFQEYTMKPAARPFGATLVVAHVPSLETKMRCLLEESAGRPQLYRIDPSGSVESLGNHVVLNGNLGRTNVLIRVKQMAQKADSSSSSSPTTSMEDTREMLVDALKSGLVEQSTRNRQEPSDYTLLTASLSSKGHFKVQRHEPTVDAAKNETGESKQQR